MRAMRVEVVAEPVLRFNDPARAHEDGTVWVRGRAGRPIAILEDVDNAQEGSENRGRRATAVGLWQPRQGSIPVNHLTRIGKVLRWQYVSADVEGRGLLLVGHRSASSWRS
jgi:hypothetical protein